MQLILWTDLRRRYRFSVITHLGHYVYGIRSLNIWKSKFWFRYVDHTFVIWSYKTLIEFTNEVKLLFLDILAENTQMVNRDIRCTGNILTHIYDIYIPLNFEDWEPGSSECTCSCIIFRLRRSYDFLMLLQIKFRQFFEYLMSFLFLSVKDPLSFSFAGFYNILCSC